LYGSYSYSTIGTSNSNQNYGKGQTGSKYQNFESWEELRDLLKSNLEPQRTTQHLYQSLYATKQKTGMDILTYSKEVEALQNTIIEQETMGLDKPYRYLLKV